MKARVKTGKPVKGFYGCKRNLRFWRSREADERPVPGRKINHESTKKESLFFFPNPVWLDNISDRLIISFDLPRPQAEAERAV
jgi:hypothetical protein